MLTLLCSMMQFLWWAELGLNDVDSWSSASSTTHVYLGAMMMMFWESTPWRIMRRAAFLITTFILWILCAKMLILQPIFMCAVTVWLYLVARLGLTLRPLTDILLTTGVLMVYLFQSMLFVFGKRLEVPVDKRSWTRKERKRKQQKWWYRVNIIGWSRSCTLYSLPKSEMILSSFMLSPEYLSLIHI